MMIAKPFGMLRKLLLRREPKDNEHGPIGTTAPGITETIDVWWSGSGSEIAFDTPKAISDVCSKTSREYVLAHLYSQALNHPAFRTANPDARAPSAEVLFSSFLPEVTRVPDYIIGDLRADILSCASAAQDPEFAALANLVRGFTPTVVWLDARQRTKTLSQVIWNRTLCFRENKGAPQRILVNYTTDNRNVESFSVPNPEARPRLVNLAAACACIRKFLTFAPPGNPFGDLVGSDCREVVGTLCGDRSQRLEDAIRDWTCKLASYRHRSDFNKDFPGIDNHVSWSVWNEIPLAVDALRYLLDERQEGRTEGVDLEEVTQRADRYAQMAFAKRNDVAYGVAVRHADGRATLDRSCLDSGFSHALPSVMLSILASVEERFAGDVFEDLVLREDNFARELATAIDKVPADASPAHAILADLALEALHFFQHGEGHVEYTASETLRIRKGACWQYEVLRTPAPASLNLEMGLLPDWLSKRALMDPPQSD